VQALIQVVLASQGQRQTLPYQQAPTHDVASSLPIFQPQAFPSARRQLS